MCQCFYLPFSAFFLVVCVSLFVLSLCLSVLPSFLLTSSTLAYFSSTFLSSLLLLSSSPPPFSSGGPAGPRPCGLEEDVRQYEQDLAKRLYQARVRASQGPTEGPQPSSTTTTSSSAASQLRSAPRPHPPGPHARHCGGVLRALWGAMEWGWGHCAEGLAFERSKRTLTTDIVTVLHCLFRCCLASARLGCIHR